MHKTAYYFLYFLIFSIPWQNAVTIPMLGTISRLIGFAMVGVAIGYILLNKKMNEIPLLILFLLSFVTLNIISYFWSINPSLTISRAVTYVQLLAMVWLVWELCKSNQDIFVLMQAFVLGAYISVIDMLTTFFSGIESSQRIAATGFDPNEMAATLALAIPLSWYLVIVWKSKFIFIINSVFIFLAIFAVVLTGSRGGMLTALVGVSVIPLTIIYLDHKKRLLISIILILLVGISTIWLPQNMDAIDENIERIIGIPDEVREGRMAGRREIWQASLNAFQENPFLGVGARGASFAIEKQVYTAWYTHNTYLSVLLDVGIFGMIIFISVLLLLFIQMFQLRGFHRICFIGMFFTLLVAIFPISWEADKSVWFLFILLSMFSTYVFRNNKIIHLQRL